MTPQVPPPPVIDGLPPLAWRHAPTVADHHVGPRALSLTADAGTDRFVDPVGEYRTHNAPALLFDCPDGEFALSARVTVDFAAAFDAGVLCLRIDEEHWAKLCFEYSPQRRPMVVSMVTDGTSDAPTRAGFLAQSPTGARCTAAFEQIRLVDVVADDLRGGR